MMARDERFKAKVSAEQKQESMSIGECCCTLRLKSLELLYLRTRSCKSNSEFFIISSLYIQINLKFLLQSTIGQGK